LINFAWHLYRSTWRDDGRGYIRNDIHVPLDGDKTMSYLCQMEVTFPSGIKLNLSARRLFTNEYIYHNQSWRMKPTC